jgi:hypothetical protein
MFTSATHSTNGANDTYTFKTSPQPMPSPSPGDQQIITNDEMASIFVITFSLSVPHTITSAPGAVFTLDRKTATWKLSWTHAQTLSATTGPDTGLVASTTPLQDWRLLVAVGFIAIAAGFLLGMFMTWRGLLRPALHATSAASFVPAPLSAPSPQPPQHADPVAWPGPPPEAPPPTKIS